MQTTTNVYAEVIKHRDKGENVKRCCRSVARELHVRVEDVEVVMAANGGDWSKGLGYETGRNVC